MRLPVKCSISKFNSFDILTQRVIQLSYDLFDWCSFITDSRGRGDLLWM